MVKHTDIEVRFPSCAKEKVDMSTSEDSSSNKSRQLCAVCTNLRPLLMVKRTKTPTSGYFSPEVIPGAERASEEREIWHQRRRKIEIISRRQ